MHNRTIAPLGKRILALIIDLSIVTVFSYALLLFLLFIMASSAIAIKSKLDGMTGLVLIAVYLLLALLFLSITFHMYFIFYESKYGATPGKKIFGLSVVSVDGEKLTRRQAIKREVLRTYFELPFILPGLLSVLLTKNSQRLGDLYAKTIVVYSHNNEIQQNFIYLTAREYSFIRENLSLIDPPEKEREYFLNWAFKHFVLKTEQASVLELEHQYNWCKQFVLNVDRVDINKNSLLRFMAEHCHQLQQKTERIL